jgi:hypothetical protein
MLELALEAGLPLIAVRTEDTVNLQSVLSDLSGEEFRAITGKKLAQLVVAGQIPHKYFYVTDPEGMVYDALYDKAVEHGMTIVVCNPQEADPTLFDAGVVTVSRRMVKTFLQPLVLPELLDEVTDALAGLTLKEIGEVVKLCMTRYGELSPSRILDIRRMVAGHTQGLQQVHSDVHGYLPFIIIEQWLKVDGELFKDPDTPAELVPRGLLFGGPPGTGKTMGAKYIADQLGLALYKLDLGTMMNKYIGESEGNLQRVLTKLDQAAPCIVLMDEIEKVFKTTDDSGVTSRLLSQLLWWLQEHRSRVLTLMTTNDWEAIPAELIRPGRVDARIEFEPLERKFAKGFLKTVFDKTLANKVGFDLDETEYQSIVKGVYVDSNECPQAKLVQALYSTVKLKLVKE